VWATSAGPTKKLTNAFKSADYVFLIFSVNESRSFQGFALMESEPDPNYKPEYFMSTEDSPI
jgi:YT521-B-like domain